MLFACKNIIGCCGGHFSFHKRTWPELFQNFSMALICLYAVYLIVYRI